MAKIVTVFFAIVLCCELCLCVRRTATSGQDSFAAKPENRIKNDSFHSVFSHSNYEFEGDNLEKSKIIFDTYRSLAPTFTLSTKAIESDDCRKDNDDFLTQLKNFKLWALRMYDSSGKISSGLLNGNVNLFGDFDECVDAIDPRGKVRGKYCLAYLQVRLKDAHDENGHEIRKILRLMQSHYAVRSKLSDPGHRVPRFSTINWAVCVPSSCPHFEVEAQLKYAVQRHIRRLPFDVEVHLDKEMCYVKNSFRPSPNFLVVSGIFGCVIGIAATATARDLITVKERRRSRTWPGAFLDCFSLKRNLKQLLSTERLRDDVESVHGIRMINAFLLMVAHKSMALFFLPHSNRTAMIEFVSQPWTVVARMASLYTDSFIMISGLLTSYSFLKTLSRTGSLPIRSEFVKRLIRIFPLLAAVILLSTFVVPEMSSGPFWNLTVEHYSRICQRSWWKNFIFLHNYFGFENMCLTHTHHLGIDSQLFFVSPLLVYLMYKWPQAGISALISMAAISTGMRYYATLTKNLSYFVYPGISVSQLMDTANFSYILPLHRLTVYIIGLITGYGLRHYGKEYKMKPYWRKLFWLISLSLVYYVISKGVAMSNLEFEYNNENAALQAALSPIAWCLFWSWIVFESHTNSEGMFGRMLSSKYCIVWTRISYAVYIIQFPIFFFNVGRQRYPLDFTAASLMPAYEFSSVIIAAAILTLLIDLPAKNLRNLVMSRKSESREKNGVMADEWSNGESRSDSSN